MGMGFSAPLGSHVPQHLREKIHAGVFVELACLLPDYAMAFDFDGEPRRQKQRSLPSLNFFDFTSAFLILTAIRCERFPSEAGDMLKHLETVRAMHKTYGGDAWLQYDRQFRWSLQFDPTRSWGRPSVEHYMTASARGLFEAYTRKAPAPPAKAQPSTSKSERSREPSFNQHLLRAETCWSFQLNKGVCKKDNCKFADTHACYTCKGPHATADCTLGQTKSENLSVSSVKGESGQPFRSRGSARASRSHAEPIED
jgi:hypothetical protein